MAASDPHPHSQPLPPGEVESLSAPVLRERLNEEISRAERHGTQLSCLLVVIDDLDGMAHEHGSELREQTLAYVAGELRSVLPGADGPRGEVVARRVLDRMHTIKVEAKGARRPLRASVGLAARRD